MRPVSATKYLNDNAITIYELAYQAILEDSPAYDHLARSLDLSDEYLEELRGFLGEYLQD
jgi:hypothetical protein